MSQHTIDEHGLLGAYVTNALTDQEREEFEDHMDGCEVCRRESREFAETFAELAWATELAPPPELRESVLSAVAALPPSTASTTATGTTARPAPARPRHAAGPVSPATPMELPTPIRPVPTLPTLPAQPAAAAPSDLDSGVDAGVTSLELARARRSRRVLALAVAAATVIALALGGWVVNLRQDAQQQRIVAGQQAELTRTINDLLAAPDAEVKTTTLSDGSAASYVISKDQDRAALIAPNVPALPSDRVYQLWTTGNGRQFRSAGTFTGTGSQQILINGNVDDTQVLAITVEPSNGGAGSTEPTIVEGVQPFAVVNA